MAKKHILKTWPEYFKEVMAGSKTFEVRKDDRDFQVGDTVELLEFDPDKALKATEGLDPQCTGFTGKSITMEITYKLDGGSFGVENGFCVLGLKVSSEGKTKQEVFKETLEALGFADHLPSQMSNSDYWLCTCTAMEKYAQYESEKLPSKSDGESAIETKIWDAIHTWCDDQANEIPDQNRRYLMDEMKALLADDTD